MENELQTRYPDEIKRLEDTIEFIDSSIELHKNRIVKKPGHTEAHSAELSRNAVDLLAGIKKRPYFGRIDVCYDDGEKETIYIGEEGLEDPNTLDRWVVSWKAPISSLFYEYTGAMSAINYKSHNDQIINVTIDRKRAIEIKNAELTNVFETTSDTQSQGTVDFNNPLNDALSKNSDSVLQTISSTIQKEQNMVIRYEKDTPLIVQGVAGSGKTSIGVHRVSYLLFNHQSLRPESVLIIGPNATFLKYIEGTLPKLQSQGINQHTFVSWARTILGFELKTAPLHEVLKNIREGLEEEQEYSRVSTIKGSLEFMNALTKFIRNLELESIPLIDLDFGPAHFISCKQIFSMYRVDNAPYTVNEKRKRVLRSVGRWVEDITNNAQRAIDNDNNNQKWKDAVTDNDSIASAIMEQDSKRMKDRVLQLNKLGENFKYLSKQWPEFELIDLYTSFATNKDLLARFLPMASEMEIDLLIRRTTRALETGIWDPEDVAPLLHINSLINTPLPTYGHIVIDEAQDFNPFEFALMVNSSANNSITILGDISQSIYSFRAVKDWIEVLSVFSRLKKEKPPILELAQSYRSTQEIITASNILLENSSVKPIGRHGQLPQVIGVRTSSELYENFGSKLQDLINKGHKSIGIIGNTAKQCEVTFQYIQQQGIHDSQLILEPTEAIKGRVVVLPEYIVKGLEFDAVIVLNVGENRFKSDLASRRLLYVLFTRARHELVLFHYLTITNALRNAINDDKVFNATSFHEQVESFDF